MMKVLTDSGLTEPVPQALIKLKELIMWHLASKFSRYHFFSHLYLQRHGVYFPSP